MTNEKAISLKDALNKLRKYGITGNDVYMVDFFPLIEMVWADGQAQAGEIDILDGYIEKHVNSINKLTGCKVLSPENARKFVKKFLEKKPDPEIMKTLRDLVKPIRLATADEEKNEKLRQSLLFLCMDIAAISTTVYPYESDERFDLDEKACFFSIWQSLSASDSTQETVTGGYFL
jgi:hypothetical protein